MFTALLKSGRDLNVWFSIWISLQARPSRQAAAEHRGQICRSNSPVQAATVTFRLGVAANRPPVLRSTSAWSEVTLSVLRDGPAMLSCICCGPFPLEGGIAGHINFQEEKARQGNGQIAARADLTLPEQVSQPSVALITSMPRPALCS